MTYFLKSPYLSCGVVILGNLKLFSSYSQMESYIQNVLKISHDVGDAQCIIDIGSLVCSCIISKINMPFFFSK